MIGASDCTDARTSTEAPSSVNQAATPTPQTTEAAKTDAQSDTRSKQLDADIRAREQRARAVGDAGNRNDSDLASEVRSKLEANIPGGNLTVASKEGVVTVSGTVQKPDQLTKIDKLGMEIIGVKSVVVKATVSTKSN